MRTNLLGSTPLRRVGVAGGVVVVGFGGFIIATAPGASGATAAPTCAPSDVRTVSVDADRNASGDTSSFNVRAIAGTGVSSPQYNVLNVSGLGSVVLQSYSYSASDGKGGGGPLDNTSSVSINVSGRSKVTITGASITGCTDPIVVAPPTGGSSAPPTGGSSAPPTGGSSAPPTGGSSAPPTGGSSAPPTGGSSAPPTGGSSAPPTGGSTAPSSGSSSPTSGSSAPTKGGGTTSSGGKTSGSSSASSSSGIGTATSAHRTSGGGGGTGGGNGEAKGSVGGGNHATLSTQVPIGILIVLGGLALIAIFRFGRRPRLAHNARHGVL